MTGNAEWYSFSEIKHASKNVYIKKLKAENHSTNQNHFSSNIFIESERVKIHMLIL